MIFESHAHYNDEAFDKDRDEILTNLKKDGIEYVINVSFSLASTESTIALTKQYPEVYGAVGVHPDDVDELSEDKIQWLKEKCSDEKVAAIGEIGLDYYWDKASHDKQKYWFKKQMDLAREVGLPVIIHSRDAAQDTLEAMKEAHAEEIGGVVHCFAYSKEMALEFTKLGFYIGIGGVVTFKNAKKVKEAVQALPIDRILLETDCPYLAPDPFRGKRNASFYLPYVAREIAALKELDYETVVEQTNINAKRLFLKGNK